MKFMMLFPFVLGLLLWPLRDQDEASPHPPKKVQSLLQSNPQKSEGAAFQVSKSGKGTQAILFLPGFACSGEVWRETRSLYEADFLCYTFTMAGFAGAPAQADPRFREWEKALADYIKREQMKKPIVIGHSMGGVMAMALAADYPDLIEKIVVVDALPCLAAMMNPTFKSKQEPDCRQLIGQISKLEDSAFEERQKLLARQYIADPNYHQKLIDWSMTSDRHTFAQMYCDFSNVDMRQAISQIKCPSLVLMQPYFSNFSSGMKEQYEALPKVDIRYANKGLHFIMYDDPEWFQSQINTFIKS